MRAFTEGRDAESPDEVWVLEHPPVFTLGQAGRAEHVLDPGPIPVIATDRGGQVTYHGPGQLVAYVLVDLARRGLGVRRFVEALEQAVIDTLAEAGVRAARRPGAAGVYVDGRKVAALGLRVRRGCTYHGLALNVDVDLEPFRRIDPCGHPGLEVTRLRDLGVRWGLEETGERLYRALAVRLGGP
jgi:lipoyl(octanoyl) transferase